MLNITQIFKSARDIYIFWFYRITGFLDNWPLLEKWFTEPEDILIKINAEVDQESLCQKVKEIFTTEIMKKEIKGNYISLWCWTYVSKMCRFNEFRRKWKCFCKILSSIGS